MIMSPTEINFFQNDSSFPDHFTRHNNVRQGFKINI